MTTSKDKSSDLRRDDKQIPEPERRGERLIGLLIWGLILLNFPILSIFSGSALVFGLPVLYFYLFSAWLIIIGITALVLRGRLFGARAADSQDNRDS